MGKMDSHWRSEEKFPQVVFVKEGMTESDFHTGKFQMKSFIRQLLEEAKQEAREEIRKEQKEEDKDKYMPRQKQCKDKEWDTRIKIIPGEHKCEHSGFDGWRCGCETTYKKEFIQKICLNCGKIISNTEIKEE